MLFINFSQFLRDNLEGKDENEVKNQIIQRLKQFLSYVLRILKHIKKCELSAQDSENLSNIINKLIFSTTYKYNKRGYSSTLNFDLLNLLRSHSLDEEFLKQLLTFLVNIFWKTNGSLIFKEYIINIIKTNSNIRQEFYKQLISCIKEDVPIRDFAEFLLKQKDTTEEALEIYKHILKDPEGIDESLIENTILYLLEESINLNADTQKRLEDFFEEIYNAGLKNIINNALRKLSPQEIVELPKKIKELSYEIACENMENYKDEKDFLIELSNYNDKCRDNVIKIVVQKLASSSDAEISDALEILERFENPSKNHKEKICPFLKELTEEIYGEKIRKLRERFCYYN